MRNTRKYISILSIITILIGFILISFSNSQILKQNSTHVQNQKQWSIAMNFEKNETLGFSFRYGIDWPIYTPDIYLVNVTGAYQEVKYLEVHIRNSNGNESLIRIILVTDTYKGTVTLLPNYFEAFNKSLYESLQDPWQRIHSSIGFSDPQGAIIIAKNFPRTDKIQGEDVIQLGKAATSGIYNLTCTLDPPNVWDKDLNNKTWIHQVSAPSYLMLYKTTESIEKPYTTFLPVGLGIILIGIVALVLSRKLMK